MALQDIINSAVNIEINRSKLIAQTISRNGRISVASRNWNNPFRFVVTPRPVWSYDDYRAQFEPLFNNDRFASQTFKLTNFNASTGASLSPGSDWLTEYQGDLASPVDCQLDNYTATSISGNSLTITKFAITAGSFVIGQQYTITFVGTTNFTSIGAASNTVGVTFTATGAGTGTGTGNPAVGQYIVRAGDYVRISGVLFPYFATADLQVSASATETILLHRGATQAVTPGTAIFVGRRAAFFQVIVTKLPQIRFLPGKLVEFTDNFELIEDIQ